MSARFATVRPPMVNDYYRVAQELASQLRAQSKALANAADGIEQALYGATASERLMGIRFNLNEVLGDGALPLPDDWRTAASRLVADIDDALRQET